MPLDKHNEELEGVCLLVNHDQAERQANVWSPLLCAVLLQEPHANSGQTTTSRGTHEEVGLVTVRNEAGTEHRSEGEKPTSSHSKVENQTTAADTRAVSRCTVVFACCACDTGAPE